jgi:hypothetical protein
MTINGTEYRLPEHIERYIIQIAEQIKADGEKAADDFIHYNRTEGEILYRRSGRTTRIVDRLIQQLYTTGEACAYDHHNSSESDKRVAKLMMRRLYHEHGGRYKFDSKTLKFTL